MKLAFTVYGCPQPQGSMKSFLPKGDRFPVMTSDNPKMTPWRQEVALTALEARGDSPLWVSVAIALTVRFYFKRPTSLAKKVREKITKPDTDKCLRAVKDALKGILYVDDSQVVDTHARKFFGLPERAEIELEVWPVTQLGPHAVPVPPDGRQHTLSPEPQIEFALE